MKIIAESIFLVQALGGAVSNSKSFIFIIAIIACRNCDNCMPELHVGFFHRKLEIREFVQTVKRYFLEFKLNNNEKTIWLKVAAAYYNTF